MQSRTIYDCIKLSGGGGFGYRYADARAAHQETDHFQRFDEGLPDLLAGEPRVTQFEVSEATELEL